MKTTIVCTSQPAWWNSVRCPAWLGALGLVAALSTRAFAQTTIPHTVAISTNLPVIAGDGLLIEIFPNIGGGAAPTAADLEGLTPIGATLCPEVGFYRHVSASGPGSLDDFFAETTLLPASLRGLNVSNFVLRITGLLKVTQAEDENPGACAITDLQSVHRSPFPPASKEYRVFPAWDCRDSHSGRRWAGGVAPPLHKSTGLQ